MDKEIHLNEAQAWRKGLNGIPDGFQIMPSSSELESDGNNLKISMIVDFKSPLAVFCNCKRRRVVK